MPTITFTSNLKRFYPELDSVQFDAKTISEVIDKIDIAYPGIKNYIIDDQRTLRHHVNIFINNTMIKDRINLQDRVDTKDTIFIMQALSGG